MSTPLHELMEACKAQSAMHALDDVPTCVLEQTLVSRLRLQLVNMDVNEEEETFLLGFLQDKSPQVEVPIHISQHLIEYLQGATR